jgi:alpha-L-rhamnosidase
MTNVNAKGIKLLKDWLHKSVAAYVLARTSRSLLAVSLIGCCFFSGITWAGTGKDSRISITDFGAVGDGQTLNTSHIQAAIEKLAKKGGGTLVIPKGVFLSGAIFLKPGVNIYLEEGAVLKGSTDIGNYPKMPTRVEGQFVDWIPALINADKCDHLRISGSGILDGSGPVFYTKFWNARLENPQVTNLAVERPRLVFIRDSRDVHVEGINFKDSGFWNLHLYRCHGVLVQNVHFEAPYGERPKCGPSTDGMDVDSSQDVTIRGCFFAVNDDCVCLKGTKGPFALQDKQSPPTEHIHVTDCTFQAGQGVVTLGSEATLIRDVVVENCRVTGKMPLVRLKLRPDTAQHYEDIHYQNITLAANEDVFKDNIFDIAPWTQFFDLKGQPPPKSIIKNVTLSNIKGSFGSFGEIEGNKDQSEISDITMKNVDVQLKNEKFDTAYVKNFKVENVTVNGKPFLLPTQ